MKILLVAIAKLENNYIREWVEHYKKIGIDHIILYDNNDICGEKISEVLTDYIESEFVTVKDVRGMKSMQLISYKNAYYENKDLYDYILYVDCDEFVMFSDKAMNVKSFINSNEKFKKYDQVRLCWLIYDDNNLLDVINNDYSVVKRFTHSKTNSGRNTQCKSFVKCGKDFKNFGAHGVKDDNVISCDCNGKRCDDYNYIGKTSIRNVAWINHYMSKTIGEFIRTKIVRGDNSKENEKIKCNIDYFFTISKKTKEKVDYAKKILGEK